MPLATSLQISASGLTAQRLNLDVISNNIANASTTRTPTGQPYRRQQVIFAAREARGGFAAALAAARGARGAQVAGAGVQVAAIQPDTRRDFKVVYDPGHPDADARGYVRLPNVEPIIEMVDLIAAARAYEAGVTAINTAKQMQQRALEIGQ
ncbi:MAG: flagellar basal body rod protein FlgC [Chloroherpetonaceae bacterium]|nr:flagellar basal body rod protein FlgC [Chthonomonadaceae bacterium]MDW8208746.1 flagellar basal body rod protein FlgC [Chloroherpetonaceae bacterium]